MICFSVFSVGAAYYATLSKVRCYPGHGGTPVDSDEDLPVANGSAIYKWQCQEACDAQPGCAGYTRGSGDQAPCWLRSAVTYADCDTHSLFHRVDYDTALRVEERDHLRCITGSVELGMDNFPSVTSDDRGSCVDTCALPCLGHADCIGFWNQIMILPGFSGKVNCECHYLSSIDWSSCEVMADYAKQFWYTETFQAVNATRLLV